MLVAVPDGERADRGRFGKLDILCRLAQACIQVRDRQPPLVVLFHDQRDDGQVIRVPRANIVVIIE